MQRENGVTRTIVLSVVFVLAGMAAAHCTPYRTDNRVRDGEALYIDHCSRCHGRKAVGEDPRNPDGGPVGDDAQIAPALNGTGHAWHHPLELLTQKIKHGLIDEKSPMPVFGSVLSDEEITSIITYLQFLWPEGMKKKYEERFDDSKLFEA